MKKIDIEDLSKVSGGIYDLNGHEIHCPQCGKTRSLMGRDRRINNQDLIEWACPYCSINFFTDYVTGEYVEPVFTDV